MGNRALWLGYAMGVERCRTWEVDSWKIAQLEVATWGNTFEKLSLGKKSFRKVPNIFSTDLYPMFFLHNFTPPPFNYINSPIGIGLTIIFFF